MTCSISFRAPLSRSLCGFQKTESQKGEPNNRTTKWRQNKELWFMTFACFFIYFYFYYFHFFFLLFCFSWGSRGVCLSFVRAFNAWPLPLMCWLCWLLSPLWVAALQRKSLLTFAWTQNRCDLARGLSLGFQFQFENQKSQNPLPLRLGLEAKARSFWPNAAETSTSSRHRHRHSAHAWPPREWRTFGVRATPDANWKRKNWKTHTKIRLRSNGKYSRNY